MQPQMREWFVAPRRLFGAAAATLVLTFNLWVSPSQAGDPFRPNSPYDMGEETEAAFRSFFELGHYPQAAEFLRLAETRESQDPLTYAMIASMAYVKQDWQSLGPYATKTREMAENIQASQPLRGNLYIAVGHLLEGADNLQQQGLVRGLPQALRKLQLVYNFMDKASAIDSSDPELNLIKGYMDLMLAMALPFANPADAIARLDKYAAPSSFADWGIAIAYRDLEDYEKANEYADIALASVPKHPELHYLKAQILVKLGQRELAQEYFQTALARSPQLPKFIVAQMFYEYCKNQRKIDGINRDCDDLRDPIKEDNDTWWGPETLPQLF